ncbi:DUF7714 family protein [Candidatus Methylobacter oryzae]|uniref:Uncharacterized protein n=1 Tax=Candidatus Methylobacter oryzae TaxID=2497749 RepID=A0ABY3CGB1_9GAMM|nr:hypothetical protein [Candidatus Methylobacter oryzae]TRX02620.1 hypothetical protein EKO24_002290 [Candidatus Methylobacter oryzae]
MNGQILQVGSLKQQLNFVPLPYRCVSFQPYEGKMDADVITQYLLGREVYRRTDIIILHNSRQQYAVAAVQRRTSETLFSPVDKAEVLALPDDCVFITDPATDPANRSALAQLAVRHRVSSEQTAIVAGTFDHINIIHRPKPLVVRVIEVVPPEPPKLYHLIEQVLSYADLPPILLELETIDLRDLAATVSPEAYLVPCRSGGLTDLSAPVHFLDERPAQRQNWTLLGCERSLQFHRHYYGDEPPRVEMCPRKLYNPDANPAMLKCCLLEYDIEQQENLTVVPWGSDLPMIEKALRQLVENNPYV